MAGVAALALLTAPALAQGETPPADQALAIAQEAKQAINLMWMLVCAFIVFLMQVGFAFVEAGFTRAKNVVHTMLMNLVVFCVAALGYWSIGFALQFGAINYEWPGVTTAGAIPGPWSHAPITLGDWTGILNTPMFLLGEQVSVAGASGFGLSGMTLTAGVLTFFIFQMVFMDTAATIPTGAMAERLKFSGFCLMALFVSLFLYPVIGGWVWGGGWLQNLGRINGLGNGVVDFAGSGVVHTVGGAIALAGAIVLGPRKGRFGPNGSVNPMLGHNIPLAVVGSIILVFGWFAFNAGSAYGVTGAFGQLAANAAVNSLLSGAAGGISGLLLSWVLSDNRKPDVSMTVNGMLAGLVAITTACAFVVSGAAVFIGLIAGAISYAGTKFLERVKIDDPVGAIPVHLFNGIWGLLTVGIFGSGLSITQGWNGMDRSITGVLFGNTGQLTAQFIGAGAIFVASFVPSLFFFMILKASDLLRAADAHEIVGLDVAEMGVSGYNDDAPAANARPQGRDLDPQRSAWSFLTEDGKSSLRPPALLPSSVESSGSRPARATGNGYTPPSTRPRNNEANANTGPFTISPTDKSRKPGDTGASNGAAKAPDARSKRPDSQANNPAGSA
jgi:Amt family ammonium transporter